MNQHFFGPLRKNPINPRYFTDETGRAIYLTGSHTWANLMEIKRSGDPDFNYPAFLDMLSFHGHNAMRLWTWDHPQGAPWTGEKVYFEPMPFERTGPGLALDGQPRFDLGKYNQTYFDRLRTRVIQAGEAGIYVSVMLFEGWCIKWSNPASDAWPSHPYHKDNNVNMVNGDPDGDGKADIYSLDVPEVVAYQKAYMRQVIDTVNDLDNVLYEIINEIPDDERGVTWHYHMIDFVHVYESTKPKQHPVGMTAEGGTQDNPILFESPADWISPGFGPDQEYKLNPPAADGRKVILTDTDHIWGHGGNYCWAWKSFLRGLNVLFMDPWEPVPGHTLSGYAQDRLNTRNYPDWGLLRANLGHIRRFAGRLDLNRALPKGELVSSHFCLAEPGKAYLIYISDDSQVEIDLTQVEGKFEVEWFYPRSGEITNDSPVSGGQKMHFNSPFGMDVVLFLYAR